MDHSSTLPWLPWLNAGLFVLQIVITAISFANSSVQLEYETLITPAAYAFSIWNVIYFFTLMTVITDVFFPGLSIFNNAAKPDLLRWCFSLSCVFNTGWVLLFNHGLVNLAMIDITLLWLVLLPIYLFCNFERDVRPFVWRQYLCSEVCIRLYFSWITAATLISWTITFQYIAGAYLSIGTYLGLLGVLVVLALVGVVYGRDPVIGLVAVWALTALAQKDPSPFKGEDLETEVRIQSAAALAAGVVFVMVTVSALQHLLQNYRDSHYFITYLKVNNHNNDRASTSQRDYGTTSSYSRGH